MALFFSGVSTSNTVLCTDLANDYSDGEWQHTIIDDKLYLRAPDYDEAQDERVVWDDINRADSAEEYRKAHQTGSRALYFAQCSDENETWLPLLEKAYAKAHGDFASIDGGFTGEAIEDLTGGVTTEIYSTDILDRDDFWKNELMQVGKTFLFGCATGFYSDWLDTTGQPREREGISEGHAYSIMVRIFLLERLCHCSTSLSKFPRFYRCSFLTTPTGREGGQRSPLAETTQPMGQEGVDGEVVGWRFCVEC